MNKRILTTTGQDGNM